MRRIGFFLVLVGMLLAVACQPEIESHTVRILGLDGPFEKEVVDGGEFHLPAAPEKEGHTFLSVTDAQNHEYPLNQPITVTSDLTLTYNYGINHCSVKVLDGDKPLFDVSIDHGSTITLSAREPAEGYHFVDLTDQNNNKCPVGVPVTVTSDLVLTYNWEINEYKIHIISGDDDIPDIAKKHGETYTPERRLKSGYIFQYLCEGDDNYPEVGAPMTVTSDLTLTYYWERAIYKIGDDGPAGGIIFYVDEGGEYPEWDYLETLKDKNGIGSYPFGSFYVNGSRRMVGTEEGVGTGKRNTEKLVTSMGDTAWDYHGGYRNIEEYAAKMCDGYSVTKDGDVYDDWFLPSIGELDLMYENLQKPGLSDFSPSWCWSSSESGDPGSTLEVDFTDGSWAGVNNQSEAQCIRPVRAFWEREYM